MTLPRESGYILTVDGRSSIALCGGWEMSSECRRGELYGSCHEVTTLARPMGGVSDHWCVNCDKPLHEIKVGKHGTLLMSIEKHVIEELPW